MNKYHKQLFGEYIHQLLVYLVNINTKNNDKQEYTIINNG